MKTCTIKWAGDRVFCKVERGPIFDKGVGYFGYSLIPIKPKGKETRNKNVSAKWLFEKSKDFKDKKVRLFLKESEIKFL